MDGYQREPGPVRRRPDDWELDSLRCVEGHICTIKPVFPTLDEDEQFGRILDLAVAETHDSLRGVPNGMEPYVRSRTLPDTSYD